MDFTLSFVAANLVAIVFQTGQIERRPIEPYVAASNDMVRDRLVMRGGRSYGFLVGKDRKHIKPFDNVADTALSGFTTSSSGGAVAADRPGSYSVRIAAGPAAQPRAISRKAQIVETALSAPETYRTMQRHTIYLALTTAARPGDTVEVALTGAGRRAQASAVYDPDGQPNAAIHVPLTGFAPGDSRKSGFVSLWFGVSPGARSDSPPFELPAPERFAIVPVEGGEPVLQGDLRLRTRPAKWTLDAGPVWEADFSSLTTPGTYRLSVPGLGLSEPFPVAPGLWSGLARHAARGLYHQRSGIALEAPHTTWTRPRSLHPDDGFIAVQSRATLMDTNQGLDLNQRVSFEALAQDATTEPIRAAWGGWHDAGDWDRRTQHLETVRALLLLAELRPDLVRSLSLDIPESGNELPDMIDEALWGLDVFARLQKPDGGVPGGIESDSYSPSGEASWTMPQRLFVYAPDCWSSFQFAATAAKAAFVLAPIDPARARDYLDRARRAWTWAVANVPHHAREHEAIRDSRNLAAAELLRATGDRQFGADYLRTISFQPGRPAVGRRQHEAAFTYVRLTPGLADAKAVEAARKSIAWFADLYIREGTGTYGEVLDPWRPYAWGNVANIPETGAEVLLPAHVVTGDPKYLDALLAGTFFGLGANPSNMTFTTGLPNGPREILNGDRVALGAADPPPGITLNGTHDANAAGPANGLRQWWYALIDAQIAPLRFKDAPAHESYQGFYMAPEVTEYTVRNGLRETILVWGYLAGRPGN